MAKRPEYLWSVSCEHCPRGPWVVLAPVRELYVCTVCHRQMTVKSHRERT